MNSKSLIIVASILVGFGVAVYLMPGPTSKSDALIWISILAGITLIALAINYIRKN